MIRLQRDAATTFVITVTELTTITTPEYLFEFVSEYGDSYYCILADSSSGTTRYNEFTITDGSDLNFPIDGFYTYKVYEQEVSGSLDPTGKTQVEEGIAHVYVVDSPANEYSNTETNNTYEPE